MLGFFYLVSQLMQLSKPPSAAISLMFTGMIALWKMCFTVWTALLSVSTPNTGKNIACSVSKKGKLNKKIEKYAKIQKPLNEKERSRWNESDGNASEEDRIYRVEKA